MGETVSEEVKEQLELEERASQVRKAVLSDAKFMAGVRRSQQEEQDGEAGRPWAEVKNELGIV